MPSESTAEVRPGRKQLQLSVAACAVGDELRGGGVGSGDGLAGLAATSALSRQMEAALIAEVGRAFRRGKTELCFDVSGSRRYLLDIQVQSLSGRQWGA